MIDILIADDHPLITEGLRSFLRSREDFCIAGTAANAAQTMTMIQEIPATVLLLDVNLPDGNGVDLCSRIRKAAPDLRILGLSNYSERSVILRMLNNGASGYLLKSAPMEELEKAIQVVAAGGIYFGEGVQQVITGLAADALTAIPPITRREKEVLQWLAQGLSSPQIGEKIFISAVTVDSHRRSLMQKLKVNNTVSLLNKAREWGLI
ncbi:response regulator [Chitinophaga qingshengii]|uniref:Response regulator transcription factor n=1 Tax=Chitinophaga qingshengii TaxID=1569794 RepID=A0ABR7TTG6_9BACT|nr:response regulator transcription factor [Chitinophaga qingshengii]MBC9932950.1 response regulator transcription factor [Chitinophaga qingshengii]